MLATPALLSPGRDYREYHTDTTVRFVVYLTEDKMAEAERIGFHKKFKLENYLNTSNLVCIHCTHPIHTRRQVKLAN